MALSLSIMFPFAPSPSTLHSRLRLSIIPSLQTWQPPYHHITFPVINHPPLSITRPLHTQHLLCSNPTPHALKLLTQSPHPLSNALPLTLTPGCRQLNQYGCIDAADDALYDCDNGDPSNVGAAFKLFEDAKDFWNVLSFAADLKPKSRIKRRSTLEKRQDNASCDTVFQDALQVCATQCPRYTARRSR